MATSRMGNNTPTVEYNMTRQSRMGTLRTTTSAGKQRITMESKSVPTKGWPSWMGNRTILAVSWVSTMVIVGVDDWRNNGIFPRPARLWAASLFFGLLALASLVEVLVPIVNALAVGYVIMLLWNYFNKQGQFA